MIGIDTNVLVRFLVDDDERQNAAARTFLAERTPEDPAFLSAVALVETVWVLRMRMQYSVEAVVTMLRGLVSADGLIIEHTEELDALINGEDSRIDDLADHLIAWSGMKAGSRTTVTFDRRAVSVVPGMELLQ